MFTFHRKSQKVPPEESSDASTKNSDASSDDGSLNHKDRLSDLKIIDNLLKTYDRRATPTNKFGKPTQVGCELFIRSFGSISEKTMVINQFNLYRIISSSYFFDKIKVDPS